MKNLRKLREEHGAGEWGTPELTKKYKNETPGQQQDEGHEEDAQVAHKAAHAALKKGDIDTYHKEMDKKFAAHQAGEKEAAKKPVKTYEATEFKPNAGTLAQIKKDHEELKSKSTKDILAIHQGQHRVRSSYTAAEIGGKHAMIGDILRNRHGDKHVSHYYGMNEETDEQKNLKVTKHEKAAIDAAKRGDKDAQKYHLDAAKNLKAESVNEAKAAEPQKHIVTVTVSDPQHAMITQRKAKIMKRVKVSAADPKEAVAKAEAHYKKHGFKVHDSLHHSIVKESLDTDEIVDAKEEPSNDQQLLSMARGQLAEIADMAKELVDSMDETDDLEPWMNAKITTAYVNLDDVHSFIAYGDEYSTDNNSEKEKDELGEASYSPYGDIDSEEKAQIARMQILLRLGLLDRTEMPIAIRAMNKLAKDQAITSMDERKILFKLVSRLIKIVAGDDIVFRRVRATMQQPS